MAGRLRFLTIAVANAPRGKYVIPLLLTGWLAGVFVLPGPQDRSVNWASALAAAGLIAFVGGTFFDALSLRRRYPPLLLAGGGLFVLLGAFCLWREPGWPLLVRLSLPLLLVAAAGFYVISFSVLHGQERTSRLKVGDGFPDFALPDSGGRVVTLASALADGPVLLLFYKGDR
jgi:hypothetical protein